MSAENLPVPLDLTAEEITMVEEWRARRQAIADYLNPPPPPPEPSSAEIRYREAVDWLLLQLAQLHREELTGNKDAGLLAVNLLDLSHKNGLIWQEVDFSSPATPRPKNRPPNDPKIRARHHRANAAIHAEIMGRLGLDLPVSPPRGEALTALLDALEHRITKSRQGRKEVLTQVIEHLPQRCIDPKRTKEKYLTQCRRFLIQDLAAFIFGEFLCRGGILAVSKDRGIYLPSFTLARDKKPARRGHAKPAR